MIRRNNKEDFLNALEVWMNEIVAKNANERSESIPDIVKQDFQKSMKTNIDYHDAMASNLQGDRDGTLAKYHGMMSEIYRTFCECHNRN